MTTYSLLIDYLLTTYLLLFCRYYDALELIRKKSTAYVLRYETNCQFASDEDREPPLEKYYNHYVKCGREAEVLGHPVDGVKGVWPFESSEIYDGYSQAHAIYVCKDFMHNYMNVVRQQLKTHIPTQQNFINRTTKNSVREACARDRIHRHIWVEGYDVKPNWVLSRKQCAAVDAKLKAIVCCPSERIPYDIMKKKGGVKAHDTHLFGAIFSSWALFRHLDIPAVVKHIKMWLQLGLMRSYIWVCNSSIMQE